MIRSIKEKLSVKVFLITFILLGVVCSGTYFCISKLLPTTYTKLINQTTETAAIQLVDQLAAYDNLSDCGEALSDFPKKPMPYFGWKIKMVASFIRQEHPRKRKSSPAIQL